MEYFQDTSPCESTGACCDVCEQQVVLADRREEMEIVLKTVNSTDSIGEKKVMICACGSCTYANLYISAVDLHITL